MTESRANPFAGLGTPPAFQRKPRPPSAIEDEAIDLIAEESGFVSREPPKAAKAPKRKPRVYRTGRNINFTLKVTGETRDRFDRLAGKHKVHLARLLELALDALEHE